MAEETQHEGKLNTPMNHMINVASYWADDARAKDCWPQALKALLVVNSFELHLNALKVYYPERMLNRSLLLVMLFQYYYWQVQDTKVQGFVPGMKLECMDRTSLETDTYWIATVVMASGPLLLLRYDGYDDDRSGDFWCDAASDELQPIGWCTRTNNILIPPAGRWKGLKWQV